MTPSVFGAGAGIGLALIVSGSSSARQVRKATLTNRIDPANRRAAAALIGAVIGLVARSAVGAAIGGAVGWTLRSGTSPTRARARVTGQLEALAAWIEALRDSVAAHRGLLAVRSNERAPPARSKGPLPPDRAPEKRQCT